MPFTTNCPQCDRLLTVPDELAGRQVRCPQCQNVFPAAPPPEPAPATTEAFHSTPPSLPPPIPAPIGEPQWNYAEEPTREPLEPGWNTVKNGVNLVRIGISILVLLMVLNICTNLGVAAQGPRRGEDAQYIQLLISFVVLGVQLMILVGRWMCVAVPPQSEVKGLMIASAACPTLSVVGGCLGGFALGFVAGLSGAGRGAPDAAASALMALPIVLVCIGLLNLVGEVLFVVALRGIARFFRNASLERSAGGCLMTGLGTLGGAVLLGVVAVLSIGAKADPVMAVAGLGSCVLLIVGLILVLWYLRILTGVRDTIQTALRRDGNDYLGYR